MIRKKNDQMSECAEREGKDIAQTNLGLLLIVSSDTEKTTEEEVADLEFYSTGVGLALVHTGHGPPEGVRLNRPV